VIAAAAVTMYGHIDAMQKCVMSETSGSKIYEDMEATVVHVLELQEGSYEVEPQLLRSFVFALL